ncbi:MAG: nucleotidyltransferase family protein [Proteobacteria bacterium]|nr:nucleotidyltransferase family protein [Pseudomonadota bacterium]
MNPNDDIIKRLAARKNELREFHVRSLAIFGSTVRGDAGADSDVDLLVDFNRPVDLIAFCELEDFLAGVVGRKVDLVPRDSVKPLLRNRIFAEAVRVL